MGTLASELGPHAGRIAGQPRMYVDANMPAGLVSFMRVRLHWDVLFVLEHEDLRRARDGEHYRLARQLGRTLLTLDRDYLDDEKFPPAESGGVIVLAAPNEDGFIGLLTRLDDMFRVRLRQGSGGQALVDGQKLHLNVDWPGHETE
jgi:predicted nuclease of predicted toxin-antitoxin system